MRLFLIVIVIVAAMFLYRRGPVTLLFAWILISPIVNNAIARPWLNPLFAHREMTQGSTGNVPGWNLRELFTFDRFALLLLLLASTHARSPAPSTSSSPHLSSRVTYGYLAFSALMLISAFRAYNVPHALRLYLDTIALSFVAYIIALRLLTTADLRRRFKNVLVIQGLLLSLIALLEYFMFGTDITHRVSGPFPFWEDLGTSAAIALIMLLERICAGTRWTSWRYGGVTTALLLLAIFLTQTRTVFVGLLMGILMTVVLARSSLRPSVRRAFWSMAFTAAIIIVLGQSLLMSTAFYKDRLSNQDTVEGRLATYRVAAHMLRNNPMFGIGFTNFTPDLDHYVSAADLPWIELGRTSLHSSYLSIAAEAGLPALIAYLFFVFAAYNSLKTCVATDPTSEGKLGTLAVITILTTYTFINISFCQLFEPLIYNKIVFMSLGVALASRQQDASEPNDVPILQRSLRPTILPRTIHSPLPT